VRVRVRVKVKVRGGGRGRGTVTRAAEGGRDEVGKGCDCQVR
jgi:hypothetical protein